MFKIINVAAVLAAVAFAGAAAAQQPATPAQPAPVTRTVIGKVDVAGTNTQVITAVVELQPGFKAGRHSHPGPVQAYVVDGEFWFAPDGQPEKVFTAGQSLEVPDGMIHNEGAVGSKPAKLIAVYVVEKGKPLVQPAQ
jgi:quercetin dioxygenase-like cupin family protein